MINNLHLLKSTWKLSWFNKKIFLTQNKIYLFLAYEKIVSFNSLWHIEKIFLNFKKIKFPNCDKSFMSLSEDWHQILSKYQNFTTNKTNLSELKKKTTCPNCDVCLKSLSEDSISETRFNLSDNFSDLFFWSGKKMEI